MIEEQNATQKVKNVRKKLSSCGRPEIKTLREIKEITVQKKLSKKSRNKKKIEGVKKQEPVQKTQKRAGGTQKETDHHAEWIVRKALTMILGSFQIVQKMVLEVQMTHQSTYH